MIKKIKRKKCLAKYPIFPQRNYNGEIEDYDYFYPETFANYILTITSKTNKKHVKALGEELNHLLKGLKSDCFIFLGDEKLAWRFREGKYKNFKKGMQFLENEGIGKDFKGGLIINKQNLPQFIKHLADLVGTNGIVQYVYFTDESQSVLGSICKEGNLHISTMNEESDDALKKVVLSTKFEFLNGKCYNQFSNKGGRPTS
ncbi:hypothetical protein ASU31_26820 [Pedobacter ginsenosidimutans]|uniref:Uncharacterized protein n=1 Tax=Pedobacter ginsenosidimutans TaxID=687842 RepID=A0A0T5VGQ9_9SPHI|nr:hypothetical protein [Pedobacter ginsenosidimutans]KRT13021.1 hypothetical protein ASU31_26820 [Pedobacter ginsenosidimutans]